MEAKHQNEHESPPPPAAPARIFVGGLAEAVNADELRRVFELCGGAVDSIDFVRTKGRSFAYVDFSPSAHNSLSNLFAKYNGCVWKGGKLKLEKAKEHYQKRFAREKAEEEADSNAPRSCSEAPQNSLTEPDKKTIRVFFPTLRKVKVLPLTGTGKHKYSFQRIDLLIRPKYFCDCEEHSGPTESGKQIVQVEAKSDGVNWEELDIMNKVMNTLFQKQNHEEIEADDDDLVINVASKEIPKVDPFTTHDQQPKQSWPQGTGDEPPSKKLKQISHNSQENSDKSNKIQLNANMSRPQKPSLKELFSDKSNTFRIASDDAPDSDDQTGSLEQDSDASTECESDESESDEEIEECESDGEIGETKQIFHSSQENSDKSSKRQLNANVSRPQKPSLKELFSDKSNNTFRIASDDAPDSDDQTESSEQDSDASTEFKSDEIQSDGEVEECESDCALVEEKIDSDGEIEERESDEKESDAEIAESESDRESEEEKTDSDGEMEECESDRELEEEKTEGEIETGPSETTHGALWMQKCSWTQLLGQNSSFSISEPVHGATSARQIITSFGGEGTKKLKETGNSAKHLGPSVSQMVTKDDLSTKIDLKDDEQSITCNESSAPVKQISPVKVEISDTCNFMRSATSLKEWSKMKSAISGPRKRKANATRKSG